MAKLIWFCLSLQGGHMLTPLPAATPMKPGSAVSTSVLLPRGREGSPGDKARHRSSSWHYLYHGVVVTSLPRVVVGQWCMWGHGHHPKSQAYPVQLHLQAPCAAASPKLPLLCLPAPSGSWGFNVWAQLHVSLLSGPHGRRSPSSVWSLPS